MVGSEADGSLLQRIRVDARLCRRNMAESLWLSDASSIFVLRLRLSLSMQNNFIAMVAALPPHMAVSLWLTGRFVTLS